MDFGQKLRTLRNDKGLTQDEVAKACGMTRRAYISYEQNNVRPRNRETYSKLASILDTDVNYLLLEDSSALESTGTMACIEAIRFASPILAMPILAASAALVSMFKRNSPTDEHNRIDQKISCTDDLFHSYEKIQKKFKSVATGIILTTLAIKNVQCQLENIEDFDNYVNKPELVLLLNTEQVQTWWFIFWSKDYYINDHQIIKPKEFANVLISRFTGIPSNPSRMVSIVVDDEELFNTICDFKNNNSYRGNLSVILIDLDESRVSKEEIISTYNDDNNYTYKRMFEED